MSRNSEHKDFLLPQAVYKQAYWTARDYNRMNEKLREFRQSGYSPAEAGNGYVSISSGGMEISDRTAKYAIGICLLEARIKAVDEALESIPEKYRSGIREKIIDGGERDYITASINTWKKWQQIFIYRIAVNLNII